MADCEICGSVLDEHHTDEGWTTCYPCHRRELERHGAEERRNEREEKEAAIRADERRKVETKIVAWLRNPLTAGEAVRAVEMNPDADTPSEAAFTVVDWTADAIERGEHEKEEG